MSGHRRERRHESVCRTCTRRAWGEFLENCRPSRSGGDNSLTSGNSATALRIIDDALADATRSQAIVGGFQKFTLDSASRMLESQAEHLSTALSDVQDTDIALETAKLAKNRLLEQTALEALSISSFRQQDILSLLRNAATRF